jgi:hypothetical protein
MADDSDTYPNIFGPMSPDIYDAFRKRLGLPVAAPSPAVATATPPEPIRQAAEAIVQPWFDPQRQAAAIGHAADISRVPMALAGQAIDPILHGAQLTRQAYEAGAAGTPMTTEEMIPGATEVAKGVISKSSPFAMRGAAGVGGGKLFTPEGLAVKGTPYSARSREVLGQLEQEPKGTGPIDLNEAVDFPVPQQALERYMPKRGSSVRVQKALDNPDVVEGVRQSIRDGMTMGAHQWYDTGALRQSFAKEYAGSNSDPGGEKAFRSFMDLIAATSPRSDVPTNIRNASFYHTLMQSGQDVPTNLPYPYGHVAQNLHKQNFGTLSAAAAEGGQGGWDIFRNPKPASFSENLRGNLEPVTVDTHAFRNVGMRSEDPSFLETSLRGVLKGKIDPEKQTLINKYGELSTDKKGQTVVTFRPQQLQKEGKLTMEDAKNIPMFWSSKPNDNEYAAVEKMYQNLGKEFNLAPAQAQAAAWAGAGKLTGLGSPPTHTFQQLLNQRIEYTARMRGEDPQETLRKVIRGHAPLLGLGGAALAPAVLQGQGGESEQQ